ncbi:hypothetical protein ABQF26_03780 [Mycolicibacterium elephantis]
MGFVERVDLVGENVVGVVDECGCEQLVGPRSGPVPDDPEDRWSRDLEWWEHFDWEGTEAATVGIAGNQYSDGRIDREIYVIFDNNTRGSIPPVTPRVRWPPT